MDRIRKGTLRFGAPTMSAMLCQAADQSHDGLNRKAIEPGSRRRGEINSANGAGATERREKGREGGSEQAENNTREDREAPEPAREISKQQTHLDGQPPNLKSVERAPDVS